MSKGHCNFGISEPYRYANWSRNRRSKWHIVRDDDPQGSRTPVPPLCGLKIKHHPEWSSSTVDSNQAICDECEEKHLNFMRAEIDAEMLAAYEALRTKT